MSFADTKWGGFAKIIVDTSTMSVGDTVRVKSVTTGTNYDKQVATVGTPLIWETDIYKDYVKICMVQTINDTPTEIGGIYKSVDYGQTIYVDNVFDLHTLQGIQGVLNAHNENQVLSIGDEVTIKVNIGGTPTDWVMQVGAIDLYNSHEVIFVSKNIYDKVALSDQNIWSNQAIKTSADTFYSNITDNDKQYIKQTTKQAKSASGNELSTYNAYAYILNAGELFGGSYTTMASYNPAISQLPIFTTQGNRVKTYNGTATAYATCDISGYSSGSASWTFYGCDTNGSINSGYVKNTQMGVLPCFRLTADS